MTNKRKSTLDKKRTRPTPVRSDKQKLLFIICAALVLIGLIWGLIYMSMKNDDNTTTPNTTETVTITDNSVKLKHGKTGKSVEQDQKDALAAVVKLLKDAGKSPTKAEPLERLKALDSGDFSVMDPEVEKSLRFNNNPPDGFKETTFQALITFHTLLSEEGKNKLEPATKDSYKNIYVDSELGTAMVPLETISGEQTIFTLQMVHVDGKWKLAPYSVVEQIRISALFSQQNG